MEVPCLRLGTRRVHTCTLQPSAPAPLHPCTAAPLHSSILHTCVPTLLYPTVLHAASLHPALLPSYSLAPCAPAHLHLLLSPSLQSCTPARLNRLFQHLPYLLRDLTERGQGQEGGTQHPSASLPQFALTALMHIISSLYLPKEAVEGALQK